VYTLTRARANLAGKGAIKLMVFKGGFLGTTGGVVDQTPQHLDSNHGSDVFVGC